MILYKTVYFWGVKSVRVACESLQDVHGESPLTMSAQGVGWIAGRQTPEQSSAPVGEARRRGSDWSGCRLPVACRIHPAQRLVVKGRP